MALGSNGGTFVALGLPRGCMPLWHRGKRAASVAHFIVSALPRAGCVGCVDALACTATLGPDFLVYLLFAHCTLYVYTVV